MPPDIYEWTKEGITLQFSSYNFAGIAAAGHSGTEYLRNRPEIDKQVRSIGAARIRAYLAFIGGSIWNDVDLMDEAANELRLITIAVRQLNFYINKPI